MAIAFLFVRMLGDCFKSRQRLEAEILVLRHQLNVLQQRAPRRVVASENAIRLGSGPDRIRTLSRSMMAIAFLFVRMLGDCFKSRQRLEAEILVLRHQLNVLQQRAPRRVVASENAIRLGGGPDRIRT